MNRPTRLVTAALTVSAALLLAACGPEGGSDSTSDKIKGADGGGKASAPAGDATSAAPSGAKRPVITFPSDFQVEFEGWTNNDPKLQAVMDDGKERLRGTYAAVIEGDPRAKYAAFYNLGSALSTEKKWISGFADKDLTLVGEARVSHPQVRISPDGSGTLFYCVDESKGSTKNRKTGEGTSTPADKAHVLYQTKLAKTNEGIWKTTSVTTTQGGCG
ncbi:MULTISPECIES: hypothetical protein [unclassified Streptomyces]|uniref:hypothetical protein n=1 Tax=unclassified Streptomyces TaxID=2593676 RepID=UPI002E10DF03|nr:hypothetical protein OG452_22025 [Streptomyces sp. NBC_01197]WSS49513.1 hypothetical protein OG708_13240 [Streptomyces sp. NBC_01180]